MGQLVLRIKDLSNLPEIVLPEGYGIHTARLDSKRVWEKIIESSFDMHEDFDVKMDRPNLTRDRIFFVEIEGVDVATCCFYDHWDYQGEAFLHMLATKKEASRKGAGKLALVATLRKVRSMGYESAVLTTDDFRVSALRLYLDLGFRPVIDTEETEARWEAIYKELGKRYV